MIDALAAPTLILLGALITDVRSRKIPNSWILFSIALALSSSFYFFHLEGLKQGAIAAGISVLLTFPLVLLGAIGAGDMKLLFALGLATTYPAVFAVIVFSFLWGAVLGILTALRKGQGRILVQNTIQIVTTAKAPDKSQLVKIPYTIALMLAWLTYLLVGVTQGGFG